MKIFKCNLLGIVCMVGAVLAGHMSAQEVGSATTSVTVNSSCNGTRFNLEPRLNAGPQNSESVDFLPNRVSPGVDLIVGVGNDTAANGNQNRMGGFDGYYVHRQGSNCGPNFEGTLSIATIDPTVVADRPRDAFFLADLVLSLSQLVEVGRTTATNLLSTTACPGGTQLNGNNPNCWPVVGIANFTSSNSNIQAALLEPHVAVDPRTAGTGAGDVYVVAQYENVTNVPAVANIQIIACTNATVSCGAPAVASGADTFGTHPYVQVRSDGTITISYWTFTKPFGTPGPVDIKFVTCKPQGAPKAPVCSTPTLVATSIFPPGVAPGDNGFTDTLFPKHANRTEAGGTTFTTFLVYDRCHSILGRSTFLDPPCTKVDVVVAFSTNGGATWSTPEAVEPVGHQFFGTIRDDTSTGTINIAYYSTSEDQFRQRAKVHLRQIAPGSTVLGGPIILTSSSTDPGAGVGDITEGNTPGGPIDFGDRIGLAAGGTGTAGQSRVYVHYTWNNVFGIFNGVAEPDENNTLISASY